MKARSIRISYHWAGKKEVPKIQLTGAWLAQLGFQIGGELSVEADACGQIVLRAARRIDPDVS